MIIVSQDGKTMVVLESAGQIYVDNSLGHKNPCIYCDFGDGRTAVLGEYKSETRCIEVMKDIAYSYQYLQECKYTGVGSTPPEFVYSMMED